MWLFLNSIHLRESASLQLKFNECNNILEPSLTYEKKRRRIRSTLQYLWDTVDYKAKKIKMQFPNNSKLLDDLVHSIYEHKV